MVNPWVCASQVRIWARCMESKRKQATGAEGKRKHIEQGMAQESTRTCIHAQAGTCKRAHAATHTHTHTHIDVHFRAPLFEVSSMKTFWVQQMGIDRKNHKNMPYYENMTNAT